MRRAFDSYEALSMEWFKLNSDVFMEKKFDRDKFISLFKKTFEVIKQYSTRLTIDRDIMDLVLNISGFVASRLLKISYEHYAATELAEAMLHCCLYEEPHNEIITKGEWYVASDVNIDFANPEVMLAYIATDLEKWYDSATE